MSSGENPLIERPDDYSEGGPQTFGTHSTSSSTDPADAQVLIVKDCDPWEVTPNEDLLTEMGIPYRIVESNGFADEPLDAYAVVLLPSTQTRSYYETLSREQTRLDEFVSRGGTLVAHTMHFGWPCGASYKKTFNYLPGGVVPRFAEVRDRAVIVEPDHPVVEGLKHEDFRRPSVSHFELTQFPESATVVLKSHVPSENIYIEYEHGEGTVLVTGTAIEGPWAVEGHGPPKQLLRNELKYVTEPLQSREISASLSTLQFIPGKSENPSEGGDILNSALMHIIPEEGIDLKYKGYGVSMEPVYDNWLGGDMIEMDDFPTTLEEAREKKEGKYLDDVGEKAFNQYRIENGVTVSFQTTGDGGVDSDTVELTFHEAGPENDDPKVSRGDQENSKTVLHDHELNGIPWKDWYGTNVTSSRREMRYYVYDDDYEFNGVEGVRVLTVWGGYAGFVQDISDRTMDNVANFLNEVWDWGVPPWIAQLLVTSLPTAFQFIIQSLAVVPNSYSVLEFIVLADGRRYARVWDASAYPSLATYLDGERVAADPMGYRPKELINKDMIKLYAHAISGLSPYEELSTRAYITKIQNEPNLEEEIEDWYLRNLRLIDRDWNRNELEPEIPRETEGTHGKRGPPIENPDEPFVPLAYMDFALADRLPPN